MNGAERACGKAATYALVKTRGGAQATTLVKQKGVFVAAYENFRSLELSLLQIIVEGAICF